MFMKCRRERTVPSERTKGKVASHDVEYKAKRKINWKNDLAIGHKGEEIFQRIPRIIG